MMKAYDAKPRRSAFPRDLRDAGPAGEVTKYWEPGAFTWYGQEVQGRRNGFHISISKRYVRISGGAAAAAGIEPGDRLAVGINSKFLAVRKGENGIPTRLEKKDSRTVLLLAREMVRILVAAGWPVPCSLPCSWDGKSGMLVARKPAAKNFDQVEEKIPETSETPEVSRPEVTG